MRIATFPMGESLRMSGLALLVALLSGLTTVHAQQAPVWERSGGHFQLSGERVRTSLDGIRDPGGEAAEVFQDPYDAMGRFPRDAGGLIDWVRALNRGLIDPRQSLDGSRQMFTVDFDILFTNTQSMPWVRFPHLQHTEWLTCANCHPVPFIPKQGANPVSMSAIIQGEFCGLCHGRVAFAPTMNCGRCHSVSQEASLRR